MAPAGKHASHGDDLLVARAGRRGGGGGRADGARRPGALVARVPRAVAGELLQPLQPRPPGRGVRAPRAPPDPQLPQVRPPRAPRPDRVGLALARPAPRAADAAARLDVL